VKKNDLANEIVRFNGLVFFVELNIKCVVRFGGFMKILEDPKQLMAKMDHFEILEL
jgi:hypothetical protein